jgi:type I restriction enzyme R subunit
MKNFDFIALLAEQIPDFGQLHAYCDKAEMFQKNFPEESASNARKALEWLVKNHLAMAQVTLGAHETLNDMVKRPEIDKFINEDWSLLNNMRTVKKFGNYASHTGTQKVSRNNAFICLRALYYVVAGFLFRWKAITSIAPFDATIIPDFGEMHAPDTSEPKVSTEVKNHVPAEAIEKPIGPVTLPKESLASEKITRKCLIDYMLSEAKWEVMTQEGEIQGGKACIEIQVAGIKSNPSGIGYCDYVLFSRGGKPYAVIEAKSTIQDPVKGRAQAIEYADSLEKQYGVRPVIYYTNGYETKVIDGLGYPDRKVISFHSHDDLEYMIQKRGRADITNLTIDEAMTDRSYQKTAIKSLVEWLNKKHRRGLLVLATGTGKTRVSISLCKLLSNNNWIKKVLFLADRTELVHQAKGNFEKLLPSESMTSLSEEINPDLEARFVFSTYQTMINYINDVDLKFSVGHFDLIIIDEAHRSVFGKYRAIFDYFDSLLIGLTATPRNEIEKSTFELLELQDEPNFEYSFEEAVKDGYLVPYRVKRHYSKIMSRGIKYDDLSAEQKAELEKVWEYEKALQGIDPNQDYHRDIEGSEIFNYLINDDTIDRVLSDLMTNGLKIQGGENIGKTIVFAYNHKHALRIVERFQALYPEKGADYCQLIDNQVKKHDVIIANFKVPEKEPQIAVSVDMMDTGIDVPEVLNLVFFKIVKSKIKFEQMIGRGTRLCKDIYGPGKDKKEFYIFDWCGNFDYFSKEGAGIEASDAKTISERLFSIRLDIANVLQSADHQKVTFDKQLHDELKSQLHALVDGINKERKDVRGSWDIIEPFRNKEKWNYLSEMDVIRLHKLGKLVPQTNDDESAKRFDVVMLRLQLSLIDSTVHFGQCKQVVVNVAKMLEKMGTVPAVKQRMDTIKAVQQPQFWENESLDQLEHVRVELREIMKLLEGNRKTEKFVIDIEDEVEEQANEDFQVQTSYKQRVVDYLANHTDNATLRKIQQLEQLTNADIQELERIFFEELGTREEYEELSQNRPYRNNVAAFIRVINGIDRQKALQIYKNFIEGYDLTSTQELYLKNILDYVCVNGDIEGKNFMEFPLKEIKWQAIFGPQFKGLREFVKRVHEVIKA